MTQLILVKPQSLYTALTRLGGIKFSFAATSAPPNASDMSDSTERSVGSSSSRRLNASTARHRRAPSRQRLSAAKQRLFWRLARSVAPLRFAAETLFTCEETLFFVSCNGGPTVELLPHHFPRATERAWPPSKRAVWDRRRPWNHRAGG